MTLGGNKDTIALILGTSMLSYSNYARPNQNAKRILKIVFIIN